jgi:hypothetical protein
MPVRQNKQVFAANDWGVVIDPNVQKCRFLMHHGHSCNFHASLLLAKDRV